MNGPRTGAFRCIAPLLAASLAVALTGGCTALGIGPGAVTETARESVEWKPDPAEMRLAEAAERAEAALTAIAMMRAAASPPLVPDLPAVVPVALQRRVTVDWIGPVESLAEALAGRAGYRFAMGGAAPARPVMVSVTARDVPLIEVLRNAGLQAGSAATLVVNANARTIRLDWTRDRLDPGKHPGSAPGKEGT